MSRPGSGNEEFPLLQDSVCGHAKGPVTDPSAYCVNGQPIRSDGAYWVVTSDHLAKDPLIYKVMHASVRDSYHEAENHEYITGCIAKALYPRSTRPGEAPPASELVKQQPEARTLEWDQQLRKIWHLDIGKLVAGFSARQPQGGNIYAEQFQGASDTRASTPSLQELDLESLSRFSWDIPVATQGWFRNEPLTTSLGVQTDAEYDRAATGNLNNKPTTVTYALNSFTVGPFFQFRLPQWRGPHGTWPVDAGRALPRTLLVLSPVQYQQQMTGNFLVFPFSQTPPPTTPPTISGQFTVHAPKVTSLFEKAGLRHEFGGGRWFKPDNGSYAEAGWEFGLQNDILSSIALSSDSITPPPCTARSSTTIASCFAGYANPKSPTYVKGFQIDSTTALAGPLVTETLHATGGYWDIHVQKALMKPTASANPASTSSAKSGIKFTLDTKADWFAERGIGRSLNTQTRYDVPLAMSLNFPVLRNFSLSPTYSAFWYSTQVTGQSIFINTFSIQAKWYFARDATVPPGRQLYFRGPSSADQTATAKLK
jgi:hypothetical protein